VKARTLARGQDVIEKMIEVEQLDEGCRAFRVVCEVREENEAEVEDVTETEGSESESDGSWEAVEQAGVLD